jgi:hypothetical protein
LTESDVATKPAAASEFDDMEVHPGEGIGPPEPRPGNLARDERV